MNTVHMLLSHRCSDITQNVFLHLVKHSPNQPMHPPPPPSKKTDEEVAQIQIASFGIHKRVIKTSAFIFLY